MDDLYLKALHSAGTAILISDQDGVISWANPAFSEVTGWDCNDAIGESTSILKSGLQDAEFYNKMWQTIRSEGRWSGEIWNRHKSGEIYLEQLAIDALRDDDDNIINYVAIFSDITDRKKYEQQLAERAFRDEVTGLANRAAFMDHLPSALALSSRRKEMLAIFAIDLDGFKEVNDSLGHRIGDLLLEAVGKRLLGAVRESDLVARIGGDEFSILLQGLHDQGDAENVAVKIIADLARPFDIEQAKVRITASVGIALFPDLGKDAEVIMDAADGAMYSAKHGGKNSYRIATNATDVAAESTAGKPAEKLAEKSASLPA